MEKEKLKNIIKLKQKKYRDLENKFIVEGKHLVEEASKTDLIIEKYSLFEKEGYIKLKEDEMKKIMTTDTLVDEIAIVKKCVSKEFNNHIIALDQIQDPGNLGTIIRSMISFSFFDLLLDNNTCDIYNSKVIRSSQGGIFNINFKKTDLKEELLKLKKEGYKIIGTSLKNAICLKEYLKTKFNKNEKYVLIVGNEGNGIRKEILDICDDLIFIEMNNIDSLNVAIALSIILYEFKN